MTSLLKTALSGVDLDAITPAALAYAANLATVAEVCPETARAIVQELADQRSHLKLIASENYSSLAVQSAMANLLTDKYAEGFTGHRFYAGCDNIDVIEELACRRARELFGNQGAAEHAYVQPHSGADANLVAFWAILMKTVAANRLDQLGEKNVMALTEAQWFELRRELGNQRLLGMSLDHGGHLTHGFRLNASAKMFECYGYGVDPTTSELNYEAIQKRAEEVRPLILLAGYSAYPREINFRRMREIADSVGAVMMVDMAHFAGLVAGGVFTGDQNPVLHAHVVTTTTHKTLRGPRGGMVLCTKEFAEHVDKGCPYVLGGPLPHVMAAKAICFKEALEPGFQQYAQNIVVNSRALAAALIDAGETVVSGGTDNHIVLVDVAEQRGLNGRQAAGALRDCGFTLNRNAIPKTPAGDPRGAWYTSGLRLGSPAVTTLGMGPDEMQEIAAIISLVLRHTQAVDDKGKYETDASIRDEANRRVGELLGRFPVYPELDVDFLRQVIGG
ncbi:MAG: glycine hydroxymethyltransferase [Planctomycetales bacterium]|nr:glycine hydroxymethyltransferase [Planctomycetales bacterium]